MALVDLKSDLSLKTTDGGNPVPVNYFTDENAKGFVINKNNSKETDFKLNKADHPVNPSIPTVFYDPKGDFVPVFTENKKATTSQESRLLLLHTEGVNIDSPLRQSNDGYTNYISPVPLNNYYDLINKDTGTLGIRNDSVDSRRTTKKQPIIIRDNNQRWGDRKNLPEGLPNIAQTAVNLLDQIGGSVLGRDPSVFTDRYIADIERLTGVANPLFSIFAEKQRVLQRRNAFDEVSSVKYKRVSLDSLATSGISFDALSAAGDLLLDPKLYNPASIYGPLSINRMGILDITGLRNKAIGIAGQFSLRALKASGEVAANVIGNIGSGISAVAGALGAAFGGINIGSGIKLKGGLSTRSILGDKTVENLGAAANFVGSTAEKIGDAAEQGAEFIRGVGKSIAGIAGDLSELGGQISKAKAVQLDPKAFEDVAVDRVNLIPYGKDVYKTDKYHKLDWIPFKFVDANNNKPIVFRAILSGITDTFTPEYNSERYIGRPDNVYVYQGTTREISFTFDVYPKSDTELITLWEKLNYLAGLTYPHMKTGQMIAPFCKLTIGQMYDNAPGYISGLTYTVMDETTWEVDFAKLPKYVQVSCTYVYVGDRLPTATQKHYDVPWVAEEQYQGNLVSDTMALFGGTAFRIGDMERINPSKFNEIVGDAGGAVNDFLG
tara:strand:+ start:256 stop:2247 length:1992 start_codon:yes stop_codon:yes gene_type:complete